MTCDEVKAYLNDKTPMKNNREQQLKGMLAAAHAIFCKSCKDLVFAWAKLEDELYPHDAEMGAKLAHEASKDSELVAEMDARLLADAKKVCKCGHYRIFHIEEHCGVGDCICVEFQYKEENS
jgi:hypothetical protein